MSRPPQPAIAVELELRRTEDAEVEGPYDRVLLAEMLYSGTIDERASVRETGEAGWRGVHEEPGLVAVLRLLGRAPSVGRPVAAGWTSQEPTAPPEAAPEPPASPKKPSAPLSLWWVAVIAAVVAASAAAAVAWFW